MEFAYPLYYGFAFDEDEETRAMQAEAISATVDQLMRLVDGTKDNSNSAVFKITVRHIEATPEVFLALHALHVGVKKRPVKK